MNCVSYNCQGLNLLKRQYIKSLLEKCPAFFIQEHWLMSNAISLLQTDFKNHVVFAKSGITENTLLQGRPYGGSGIFICRSFPYISIVIEFVLFYLSLHRLRFCLFLFICHVTHIITHTSSIQCYTSIAG